jgi:branched-chain amino acid transport system substrate-binding protein
MNKKVFIKITVITLLIFTVFSGFGCTKKDDVIKMGAVFPLTGSMAPYGISIRQGIDLALEEINAAGGINGKKLEIIYEDSQGDPKTGVSAFNKLHMIDKVPLVFGSLTGVILAIQPEADKNDVVLINTSAISPLINEKADNFLFNFVVNSEPESIFMAEEFQDKYPNEKIAVFHGNTPPHIYAIDIFTQNLSQLGNSNYFTESYEMNTTDFRVQLDRIKRSGAKYGYLLAVSNKEFADILKQSKELNLNIQWFSIAGIESRETVDLAREAADGVIYSYPKIIDDALYSNFQRVYNEKHNAFADVLTVSSYDTVHLISAIIKEYGDAGLDIQNGLRSISNYYGIFGKYKLSNTGKQFVDRELIWKTIENGEFKIME